MSRNDIRYALFIALFFAAAILFNGMANNMVNDPDPYWHIAAGRWMISHGAVLQFDPFSNSMPGTKWITHEWLSEVIFAIDYQWFGWTGIILLANIAAVCSLSLFAYFISRWLDPLFSTLIVGSTYLLFQQHLLARPHIFGMVFLVLVVGVLVLAREKRVKPSFWLLPLMMIWANLHGSFIIGLGFAGYLAVEACLQEGWHHGKYWVLFFVLSITATLTTPNGFNGLLIFAVLLQDQKFAMSIIEEWKSPNFHLFQPLEIWLLGFVFVFLAIGVRVPVMRLIIVLGLLHLALKYIRNVELMGLLSPMVLLPSTAPQIYAAIKRDFRHLVISPMLLTIVSIAMVVALTNYLIVEHHRTNDQFTPVAGIDAAKLAGASGPVFNSYNFGGYLIFSGIAPFIDGRSEMYGDTFVKHYADADFGESVTALTDLIAKYNFGWAIVMPHSMANLKFSTLGWRRIHSDDVSVVYLRPDKVAESQ
jgi:hypothetical protein